MKKLFIVIAVVVLTGLIAMPLLRQYTKSFSPEASASYEQNGITLSVNYCQPYAKGRLIFGTEAEGAIAPYGKAWRTGANEATEITFSDDVYIQGKRISKGTYSLYSIPGQNEWEVAINGATGYWGAGFGNVFDESKDVVRGKARVITGSFGSNEQLTLSFLEIDSVTAALNISWVEITAQLPIRLVE